MLSKRLARLIRVITSVFLILGTTLAVPLSISAAPKVIWDKAILVAEKTGPPYGTIRTFLDTKGDVLVCWTKTDTLPSSVSYGIQPQELFAQKIGS
ncbi:MAG: hypothetical protein HY779_00590, partial [Rubrobacteridae bacterium]|nr:hypothetical protein [Rubrobacteridae bacterium]